LGGFSNDGAPDKEQKSVYISLGAGPVGQPSPDTASRPSGLLRAGFSPRAVGGGVMVEWGLARVTLSDTQWREIQKASGLTEGEREHIDDELAQYDYLQQVTKKSPRPAATRKKLLRIAKLADDLLTAIIGDDANARAALSGLVQSELSGVAFMTLVKILSGAGRDVLQTLTTPAPQAGREIAGLTTVESVSRGLDIPRLDALKRLCQQCWTVEQLRLWAENAACELPAESKGAHIAAEINKWLVSRLDAILFASTGRHVSRSYKDYDLQRYIQLCFAAANPDVGPGSIKEAIQAYVRLKPRRRARDGITDKNRA